MKKSKQFKRYSIPKTVIFALIALVMFWIVIDSYVSLNSMYSNVSKAQSQLTELKSENVRLESKLQSQVSVRNVEEYAENILGMERLDSSQIKYIQIQDKDVVTLPASEENFFVSLKIRFGEFIEYLKG
ncbi:MAG: hypothetical protein MRZ46_04240 [Oscillospiraceae bacterium]|nr:hypothetical protein [Oscillospiraceae bacterium]